jgi:hypothetical protein
MEEAIDAVELRESSGGVSFAPRIWMDGRKNSPLQLQNHCRHPAKGEGVISQNRSSCGKIKRGLTNSIVGSKHLCCDGGVWLGGRSSFRCSSHCRLGFSSRNYWREGLLGWHLAEVTFEGISGSGIRRRVEKWQHRILMCAIQRLPVQPWEVVSRADCLLSDQERRGSVVLQRSI